MEAPFYIPKTAEHFLALQKPIIFFDLETTGTSVLADRVVELYAIKLHTDGTQTELHHYINPGMPIPPSATAVHGITDEMVANQPPFASLAGELALFFEGCDLAGYNIKKFDVPLLMREFDRCRKYPINYNEVRLVDVMAIYHAKEKRDLAAAVKFYCQREHADAHSAKADVQATIDVLKKQLLVYDDLEPNTSFLHDYLSAGNEVDLAGRFIRDEGGRIIFNFGKHQGKEACTEPDYLKWLYQNEDFPVDTRMVAKKVFKQCEWEAEIKTWLAQNKLLENKETAAALYSTAKYGEGIKPFAVMKNGDKLTITYQSQPPSAVTLQNKDAVRILLSLLDTGLRQG